MVRRPPDFRGEAITAITQCFYRSREQQRLANGDNLRLEALLRGLDQKVAKSGGIITPVTISTPASLKAVICEVKSLFSG